MVEIVAAITNQVANTDFSIIVLILHKKELKLKKHLIMQLHTIKHVSQNQFTMWSKTMYEVTFSFDKVEKILKGSLDSIPSPSPLMKIQIMVGKICLRCKDKTLLGDVNKLFAFPPII